MGKQFVACFLFPVQTESHRVIIQAFQTWRSTVRGRFHLRIVPQTFDYSKGVNYLEATACLSSKTKQTKNKQKKKQFFKENIDDPKHTRWPLCEGLSPWTPLDANLTDRLYTAAASVDIRLLLFPFTPPLSTLKFLEQSGPFRIKRKFKLKDKS